MSIISTVPGVEQARDTQPTVRVLTSEAEIATCADAWKKLQRHPNVDWDFYWHINQIKKQSPCVLELKQNGETRSLWIGRIEQGKVPIRLGYIKLGGLKVSRLNIITGGFLGDDSEEACSLMLQRGREALVEKGFDVLSLSYVPSNHPLTRLAATLPSRFCRDWGVVPAIHWRMGLPVSYAEFLKQRSKKHRYWLNRLPRVLEEAYPGKVRIRSFRQPNEVEEFCRDADKVAQSTYQHQLGEAFRADADYKTRCQLLAAKGGLRGYVLYLGDEPRAYWMATACHDTVYLNLTGYCPEFRKFELGTILLMRLFEEHCGTAVKKVDFGHGGAMYKERFGDENFYEASLRVYRPSPRSLMANVLTGVDAKISAGLKAVLAKLGLLQKLKTFWRSRLQAESTTKERP